MGMRWQEEAAKPALIVWAPLSNMRVLGARSSGAWATGRLFWRAMWMCLRRSEMFAGWRGQVRQNFCIDFDM